MGVQDHGRFTLTIRENDTIIDDHMPLVDPFIHTRIVPGGLVEYRNGSRLKFYTSRVLLAFKVLRGKLEYQIIIGSDWDMANATMRFIQEKGSSRDPVEPMPQTQTSGLQKIREAVATVRGSDEPPSTAQGYA